MRAALWLAALAREAALARTALSWGGAVRAYKGGADGSGACNSGTVEGSTE